MTLEEARKGHAEVWTEKRSFEEMALDDVTNAERASAVLTGRAALAGAAMGMRLSRLFLTIGEGWAACEAFYVKNG